VVQTKGVMNTRLQGAHSNNGYEVRIDFRTEEYHSFTAQLKTFRPQSHTRLKAVELLSQTSETRNTHLCGTIKQQNSLSKLRQSHIYHWTQKLQKLQKQSDFICRFRSTILRGRSNPGWRSWYRLRAGSQRQQNLITGKGKIFFSPRLESVHPSWGPCGLLFMRIEGSSQGYSGRGVNLLTSISCRG
jgi:hypothetical protein